MINNNINKNYHKGNNMSTYKERFSELLEKKKFTVNMNPKKMSDDDLMDWISWMENIKKPSTEDKNAIKVGMDQMKKRGFI